jgi:hypothetical protein
LPFLGCSGEGMFWPRDIARLEGLFHAWGVSLFSSDRLEPGIRAGLHFITDSSYVMYGYRGGWNPPIVANYISHLSFSQPTYNIDS